MSKHIGCDEYRDLTDSDQFDLASKIIKMVVKKNKHLEIAKKLKVSTSVIGKLVVRNGLSRKGPYKGKLPALVPDPIVYNIDSPVDPRILENPPEDLQDGSKRLVKSIKLEPDLDQYFHPANPDEPSDEEEDEGPIFREQAEVMATEKVQVPLKKSVCDFLNKKLGYFFAENLDTVVITTKEGSTYTFRG